MAFTIKAIRGLLELEDRWTSKLTEAATKTTGFSKQMEKQLDDIGGRMTKAGATLTAAFTVPIAGVAAGSLKLANDFEGVMNRVSAAVEDSEVAGNLDKMRAAAQEWGAKTVFSSKQAAEAMIELGKAGFNTEKSIAALPSVLQLAVAGQMEMSEAATLTANTMATFGLSADKMAHANDVLALAANKSTIDVRDLAETFKYVGPVAGATKVSLEQVSAAAALLGTAGIKGSQAGTTLRGALAALMSPTTKQREAMEQLGIAHSFANGKMESLVTIIDKMQKSGADASVVMQAFGRYSGPGMVQLMSLGSAALGDMNNQLQATQGYAEKVADTYMKGLPGALERAKGSLETAGIAIGSILVPALEATANATEKVANFITEQVVPAFSMLPKPIQAGIGIFAALAAAAGPVLMVFGSMATGVSALIALLPGLAPILAAAGATIAALAGPVTLVVGALAALGIAWYKWGDDVTAAVTNTYNSVKEWLVDKWEGSIFQSVARLLESIIKLWAALEIKVIQSAMNIAVGVAGWLVDKLKPVYDFLKPFFDGVAKVWTVAKDTIIAIASAIYTGVKTYLVDKFSEIVAAVKGKIDAVTGFFNNMYDKVVGHSYVPDMVDEIGQHFDRLQGNMITPAKLATESVAGMFFSLAKSISESLGATKGTANDIASLASGLIGSFQGGGAKGLAGFAKSEATSFAKDFTSTILSFVPAVGPLLQKLGGPIVDGVKKLFGGMFQGNDARKMFINAFGDLDTFHVKLSALGDVGERFWVKMTQQTGKGDTKGAAALIDEITTALGKQQTAADQVIATTEKQTTAQTEYVSKLQDRMKNLTDEYTRLQDDVSKEAPEEFMGVVEAATRARMDQIKQEQFAVQAQMDAVTSAAADTHADIAAETARLHTDIQETWARNPLELPFYYKAQNEPPTTAVPSGTYSVGANQNTRAMNVTMNMDGRTVARASLPYLADEVELTTS